MEVSYLQPPGSLVSLSEVCLYSLLGEQVLIGYDKPHV